MPAINLNRRTLITSVAAAGVASTLAACAGEPEQPETVSPGQTEPAESASAVKDVVIGKVSDVAIGSGTKFEVQGRTVLVTQPMAGDFRAFDATCTHSGCIVNGILDGEIACGCHGARFAIDSGMVLSGPARSALGKLTIEIIGDELVLKA